VILRATVTAMLLLAGTLTASGQLAAKLPHVGLLTANFSTATSTLGPFTEVLAALGYVDGKTIHLHIRYAEGQVDRLPALAAELVQANVDVIVAWGIEPLEAARKATSRIPIVFVGRGDPVAAGVVASLAKPGGNITGISLGGPQIAGKRLELLRDVLPGLSRAALLRDPSSEPGLARETEAAARVLNLRIVDVPVRTPADFDRAFRTAVRQGAQAVVINETSMLTAHRGKLAELALTHRLSAIGLFRSSAEVGFLMSYGPDATDLRKRAASLVDRILRGAKPADLPFEQPTKFDLVINSKTAKALGLTIPARVLMRADLIVE
jgi:putative ABC transport system substrate-binding protein